jgi:hypothetical protein
MVGLVRIFRGFCGVVAILQVFGLLPVLSWLQNIGAVTAEMWIFLAIKLVALAAFAALFFGLRPLVHWLHMRKYGSPHPSLESIWSF